MAAVRLDGLIKQYDAAPDCQPCRVHTQGKVWGSGPTAELFAHPKTVEFSPFIRSEL